MLMGVAAGVMMLMLVGLSLQAIVENAAVDMLELDSGVADAEIGSQPGTELLQDGRAF